METINRLREEMLQWIKDNELTQYQGGYLLYADDMEELIKKKLNGS